MLSPDNYKYDANIQISSNFLNFCYFNVVDSYDILYFVLFVCYYVSYAIHKEATQKKLYIRNAENTQDFDGW